MDNKHYIYGLHAVRSVLTHCPQNVLELLYERRKRDNPAIQALNELAEQSRIQRSGVSTEELDELVKFAKHQGVAAQCQLPQVGDEDDLNARIDKIEGPALVLVLDGVQDPHNLGACLRTADAAGVHALVMPKDRSVSITNTVVKVASGAAYTVPTYAVTNLGRSIRQMQDSGIWFVGTDAASEETIYSVDMTGSIGIVMGAEGSGVRRLTKEICDYLVSLPMQGTVESLNVSVATGICLYEALRQRRR